MIGYEYGSQKYPKDTLTLNAKGLFVFEGNDTLKNGLYFIVLQPNDEFLEFIVDQDDHHFSIEADAKQVLNSLVFKNSSSNQIFQDFLAFMQSKQAKLVQLAKQKQSLAPTPENTQKLQIKLNQINHDISQYQKQFIQQHKGSLPAMIVKSLSPIKLPNFTGSKDEILAKQLAYQQAHYWDNIDFLDKRLLYTNFLDEKMTYYINKLIPQNPDSIWHEIDFLLKKMAPNNELFQYYLITFINKYGHTVTKGLDAVYVHLVKEYLAKGKATAITEDQLATIIRDAELREPLLIGKKAPNITLYQQDGSPKAIYDTDKPYTLLFFWGPDCGHCQEAAPFLVDFYKKYKDQVEVITICNDIGDEKMKKCWQGVADHGYNDMINLVDPKYTSSFKTVYYVKMTPTIYLLDKNKVIIQKNILSQDLSPTMKRILANNLIEKN